MEELESQIAKIQLGNQKSSNSVIYVLAEKAAFGAAELYMVAELPLLNPAAEESCQRICLAIAASLKRTYKRPGQDGNFENAISQINDELGKLAAMGQAQWIEKLSCVLGVKDGQNFNVASCGKVGAYLLRGGEFTDISCSSSQSHPLKTFENYASGRLKLGDLLILSTAQLFNYLSLDRLLQILSGANFLSGAQTIIELLKQIAGPQVGFGVLFNLQIPLGQAPETEVDLEDYVVEVPAQLSGFLPKVLTFVKTMFSGGKTPPREPQTGLPKVGLAQNLKNWSGNTKNFLVKGRGWWQTAKTSASAVKTTVSSQNFRQYSPQKKFLIASILILLIALAANIGIAVHLKKTKSAASQTAAELQAAGSLLSNAQSSLLYKDDAAAAGYLSQAKSKLPDIKSVPSSQKTLYNQILSQIQNLQAQMEKVTQAKVTNLGSLAKGGSLIVLPQLLAVQSGQDIVSFNRQTGQVSDGSLKSAVNIVSAVYLSGSIAAVYDGASLYVWDFSTGALGPAYSQQVPGQNDFGGMAYYPVNKRVYVADKKNAQVVSFSIDKNSFARPVVSVRNPNLGKTVSLAIDTAVYALGGGAVSKFMSGNLATFNVPNLTTPLSDNGKVYAQKGFTNIYILDIGNKRILVLNKTGSLVETLKSDLFTSLSDFAVDEVNKIIFVLNDGSLLKVALP
jgi:hypothetical protein